MGEAEEQALPSSEGEGKILREGLFSMAQNGDVHGGAHKPINQP